MAVKKFEKVEAFVDGSGQGLVGHVVGEPNDDGKHPVQVGAEIHWLAYRETGGGDDTGRTFRKIG